ncbi:hypothetical protein AK812_SmicGene24919 [Symbiodinium microadriaticum]|uniref:Uncharacterized protein n=1 Tax=Symbiodinium microadriaticum TaxID=2951 RepID=A0A1Q9DDL0_SYMMI|nr:hypothetical protein AK812_SmicGene24919 [Symbiodinium microadriaticum]
MPIPSEKAIVAALVEFLQKTDPPGNKQLLKSVPKLDVRALCERHPEHFTITRAAKGPYTLSLKAKTRDDDASAKAKTDDEAVAEVLASFIASRGGSMLSSEFSKFETCHPEVARKIYLKGSLRRFCLQHSRFSVEASSTNNIAAPVKVLSPTSGEEAIIADLVDFLRERGGTASAETFGDFYSRRRTPDRMWGFAVQRAEEELRELRVDQIRWAHDSIKERYTAMRLLDTIPNPPRYDMSDAAFQEPQVHFRNGMLLVDTLKDLVVQKLQPSQLPPFFVWRRGSAWFAITGNRRLWVLKELSMITGAPVTARVRELGTGAHLMPWFRRMFTTSCDGEAVQLRSKGRHPSMQRALQAAGLTETGLEMLMAREVQQASGALSLTSLHQKLGGEFPVAVLVRSLSDLLSLNSEGIVTFKPATPQGEDLSLAILQSKAGSRRVHKARGEPSASKTLPAQPPTKKPPPEPPVELWRQKALKGLATHQAVRVPETSKMAKGPEEVRAADPWASGQDPWSQSLEQTKSVPLSGDQAAPLLWKSPPLVNQPPSEDPWASGTDPWSAAKPISSLSPPPARLSGPTGYASPPPPKPKPPPPPVPSSSEESDAVVSEASKSKVGPGSTAVEIQEEWEQLFPSKAFAAAGLHKKANKKAKKHDMLYGWILRSAGGELPVDILVNLTSKAGHPCDFKPTYFDSKRHLFEEKNGIVFLAAPPAVEVLSVLSKQKQKQRMEGRREAIQKIKVLSKPLNAHASEFVPSQSTPAAEAPCKPSPKVASQKPTGSAPIAAAAEPQAPASLRSEEVGRYPHSAWACLDASCAATQEAPSADMQTDDRFVHCAVGQIILGIRGFLERRVAASNGFALPQTQADNPSTDQMAHPLGTLRLPQAGCQPPTFQKRPLALDMTLLRGENPCFDAFPGGAREQRSFTAATTVVPAESSAPVAFVQKVIQVLVAEFLDAAVAVQCAKLCNGAGIQLVASLRGSLADLVDSFLSFDKGVPACYSFPFVTVVALNRNLDALRIFSPFGATACTDAAYQSYARALRQAVFSPLGRLLFDLDTVRGLGGALEIYSALERSQSGQNVNNCARDGALELGDVDLPLELQAAALDSLTRGPGLSAARPSLPALETWLLAAITPWFLVGNGGMDPYDFPTKHQLRKNVALASAVAAYLGGRALLHGYKVVHLPATLTTKERFLRLNDVDPVEGYTDSYVRGQYKTLHLAGRKGTGYIFDTNTIHKVDARRQA